jgi:hypothetical protein
VSWLVWEEGNKWVNYRFDDDVDVERGREEKHNCWVSGRMKRGEKRGIVPCRFEERSGEGRKRRRRDGNQEGDRF